MLISVVVPVYNEQEVLPHLFEKLPAVLERTGYSYEIIVVNDGSHDGTADWMRQQARLDDRIKLIQFSRNFGQQAAMTAGLDYARGDVVVVMDADLQDPPELLDAMLEKYYEGYDVVSCQRISRAGETWFKKFTATAFYELMRRAIDRRIPAEVGDFRLYSRDAVDALRAFREQHRFMRGLVAWLGLREAFIPFHRPQRVAGETKYPVSKLIKLAWTAISSSSAVPLKLCTYLGWIVMACGLLSATLIPLAAMNWISVSLTGLGWATFQLALTGFQLIAIGLLGDYVGRIYEESKQRPLYIVAETCNVSVKRDMPRSVWMSGRADFATSIPSEQESDGVIRIPTRAPRRAA
ncbi:MAG: glycosyltransferase family 2 protein [Pirellula sp.]|nr:glycosyltransferase family 2 protein [Pirellula sp.]